MYRSGKKSPFPRHLQTASSSDCLHQGVHHHPQLVPANFTDSDPVCHSDKALIDIEDRPHFNEKYTLVLTPTYYPSPRPSLKERCQQGHEGSGEIVRIGADVTDPKFQIGTRVACVAVPGCGDDSCPECSRDLSQLCSKGFHHGIGQDGFYAPYVAVAARGCIVLPEGRLCAVSDKSWSRWTAN